MNNERKSGWQRINVQSFSNGGPPNGVHVWMWVFHPPTLTLKSLLAKAPVERTYTENRLNTVQVQTCTRIHYLLSHTHTQTPQDYLCRGKCQMLSAIRVQGWSYPSKREQKLSARAEWITHISHKLRPTNTLTHTLTYCSVRQGCTCPGANGQPRPFNGMENAGVPAGVRVCASAQIRMHTHTHTHFQPCSFSYCGHK